MLDFQLEQISAEFREKEKNKKTLSEESKLSNSEKSNKIASRMLDNISTVLENRQGSLSVADLRELSTIYKDVAALVIKSSGGVQSSDKRLQNFVSRLKD